LPEYYLTRTEISLTEQFADEIADKIGPAATLIELGSGSSMKTRLLLDRLHSPKVYIPVDISEEHLQRAANDLQRSYPTLTILPHGGDFTREVTLPPLPPSCRGAARTVYFPGSTIGNFSPPEAGAILRRIGRLCGKDGGLLIGIDLQKDVRTIQAAYDDAQGVTAEFNLNLLKRINRELNGTFDVDSFRHFAFYDSIHHRVDIRLVSNRAQTAEVDGIPFAFECDEPIHTEHSYKFTVGGFARLAAHTGFELQCQWTDANNYFALLYFVSRT
jgi:dimethylhistidine N-methyltransferase